MDAKEFGDHVRHLRRTRGYSQAGLAARIGRSESWVSQVERGVFTVDKVTVLTALAKELEVKPDQLVDGPMLPALVEDDELPIAGVREHFTSVAVAQETYPGTDEDYFQLRQDVWAAYQAYQAAEYEELCAALPGILRLADRIQGPGYIPAYALAAKMLAKLGDTNTSYVAADRCAVAASRIPSDNARGLATYEVAQALSRLGRIEDGEQLAVGTAEELQRRPYHQIRSLASVIGCLWISGALMAAKRGDRGAAYQRLRLASRMADVVGQDLNLAWTEFGPTRVALHRVRVAAELQDLSEATHAADQVRVQSLAPELRRRRADLHLTLAWAHATRRNDPQAVLQLTEVHRVAPQLVKYEVGTRRLIRSLVARGGTGPFVHDLTREVSLTFPDRLEGEVEE
ncbi:helix-turn-helix domain-containing protein [Longispora albida]|uniref:helix-turn-helix domain-containing protein n=1 Tax=Longispora albida TaxID=203523 RepID=UPI00035C76F7|nr:helix-turn-helix domain-containing protein [Longispora albida]